jgi:energy-coupling factor transporter ATP-binding protein EcfA2
MSNVEDFIDLQALEENIFHQEDWYDEISLSGYLTKLNHIKYWGLTALLGDYGSWKSLFLAQLQKLDEDKNNNIWINFDAWQYPDRRQLRDGFVLKLAEQLIPKSYPDVQSYIDAWKKTWEKIFGNLFDFLQIIESVTLNSQISSSLKAITSSDPQSISRIFQYESLLKSILISNDQESVDRFSDLNDKVIYIILEDVDRSWEEGLFFLETLKNFIDRHYHDLRECSIFKKMIIICPVAKQSWHENFSRYLKVFTKYDFFNYNKTFDTKPFVDKVFKFDQELRGIFYLLIVYVLKELTYNYRIFKFILRNIIKEYIYRTDFLSEEIDLEWFLFLSLISYRLWDQMSINSGIDYRFPNLSIDKNISWVLDRMIRYKFNNRITKTVTNTIVNKKLDDQEDITESTIQSISIMNNSSELEAHIDSSRRVGDRLINVILKVPKSYVNIPK